jgi:nucleotide-binding universal stress UspA family protein
MRVVESVLLATDFGPAGRDAARGVARLGEVFELRVTLLHVLEPPPSWPEALHEERSWAAGFLHEVEKLVGAGQVTVAERALLVGPPADTIVAKAEAIHADLVVVGAGDPRRCERFGVGPVAEAVLQQATQPVLVVRPGTPEVRFRTILCPVDHSPVSDRGLRNAIRLARAFGGRVVVVSVVPHASWLASALETGALRDARAEHDRLWRAELDRFLAGVEWHGVSWTKEVRAGVPHVEIAAAVRAHGADLIVMGATGRTGLARVLVGSTTRRLLRELPCSLLTVKEEDVVVALSEDDVRHIDLLLAEGRELLANGCAELARAKFYQVLARDPCQAAALEGLAEAVERLGHADEARRCRQRADRLRALAAGVGVGEST